MFIRRQDMIDRFAANFSETAEGEIFFGPVDYPLSVPVPLDEYESAMAAFERRHVISMVISWVMLLATMAAMFYLAGTDRAGWAAGAFACTFFVLFILHRQVALGVLRPILARQEARFEEWQASAVDDDEEEWWAEEDDDEPPAPRSK